MFSVYESSRDVDKMTFNIRNATTADASTIADYNNRLAEETEARSLDPDLIGPGVEAIIADLSKGRYWVAVTGDKIIGQIAVTYEWSDWRKKPTKNWA